MKIGVKREKIETAFTRCQHILKTVKNVTVAEFELAFTRCWNNLETVGNLTVRNSLQDFDAIERYLHPKCRSVLFQKRPKLSYFHYFQVFARCRFQNVPVRVPFSKSTVFKICRRKMCRFRVNRRPISYILHHFQNVPASCERSLKQSFVDPHSRQVGTFETLTQLQPELLPVMDRLLTNIRILHIGKDYITLIGLTNYCNLQLHSNTLICSLKSTKFKLRPLEPGGALDQILVGDVPSGFKSIPVPYTNFLQKYTRSLYQFFDKVYPTLYFIPKSCESVPFLIPKL